MASIKYQGSGPVDFVVEVAEGKEITVLQITDTQIIDAAQARSANRLTPGEREYWLPENIEARCFACLREIIGKAQPDLILHTGDMVYGEFDDAGTGFRAFVDFMERFSIPWAPVFGNHDNESAKGVDWQCEQLEKAEYCLFRQRNLTGNGNYTVGIRQGGQLRRVFVLLDSNGCGGMSDATKENGHSSPAVGFGEDQIAWYTQTIRAIRAQHPQAKISCAFHIQPQAFADAFAAYGFCNDPERFVPVSIDRWDRRAEGDFGYLGSVLKNGWDADRRVWNSLKNLGVDSVLVGHEHCSSGSVLYDGIRCQYGQKTGTYDRANYLREDGTILGAYGKAGIPIIGGTMLSLSKADGSIQKAGILLSEKDS